MDRDKASFRNNECFSPNISIALRTLQYNAAQQYNAIQYNTILYLDTITSKKICTHIPKMGYFPEKIHTHPDRWGRFLTPPLTWIS